MELELQHEKEILTFMPEYALTKKPLQIDLIIVKNKVSSDVSNPIGAIFKKYNIMEYKSPDAHLNIDTFYKVNAYACLFKDSAQNVNGYHASDITITFVRKNYPQRMFQILMEDGYNIIKKYPGIYYVTGALFFATQVLVTSELEPKEHHWLAYLDNNISKKSYERLLEEANVYMNKRDFENRKAVLQVVSNVNKKAIQTWKEESDMCEALREIMADELAEEQAKGVVEGRIEGMDILIELVQKLRKGMTSEELLHNGYTDMEISKALRLL